MSYPLNFRFSKDHEWVRLEGDHATIGISSFAQDELGEIVFVDLPKIGSSVTAGASVCVVESTKAASDVYAPIAGTVSAVNEKLSSAPELINQSPHEKGWLVELSGVAAAEVESLMSSEEYQAFLARK